MQKYLLVCDKDDLKKRILNIFDMYEKSEWFWCFTSVTVLISLHKNALILLIWNQWVDNKENNQFSTLWKTHSMFLSCLKLQLLSYLITGCASKLPGRSSMDLIRKLYNSLQTKSLKRMKLCHSTILSLNRFLSVFWRNSLKILQNWRWISFNF